MTLKLKLINKINCDDLKPQINEDCTYDYLKNNTCPILNFKVHNNIKEIVDNVVYRNIHNIIWTHSKYNLKRFNILNKSNILKAFK